jgi:hypothetical protein
LSDSLRSGSARKGARAYRGRAVRARRNAVIVGAGPCRVSGGRCDIRYALLGSRSIRGREAHSRDERDCTDG